jgi:hypothetical protein
MHPIRFLAQFSCQNHLQSPATASIRESIDREGLSVVDKCIVAAMEQWLDVSKNDRICRLT